jgi:hypothetical protein
MLKRIMTSVAVAASLVAAPVHLSARVCILSNAPSEKACQSDCCANKTCCATSPKNTAPASQSLAKSASNQTTVATSPSMVASVTLCSAQEVTPIFSSADCSAHSPPTLVLICIRLI